MNAIGVIFTLLFGLVTMSAPRQWAVLGVFASVCYITQGQVVDIFGFHFTAIRLVLLMGFIRIIMRGEIREIRLNGIDKALVAYTVFSCLANGIRNGIWQESVGGAYNILLSYFVIRCLVTKKNDLQEMLPRLAVLILPLAIFMLNESLTGSNIFNGMGGLPEQWIREGRYRCMGSFRGPHMAGIFGATLMPLFASLLFISRHRWTAVAGIIAASTITFTSNSSGPLMGYLGGLVGLAFWPLHKRMRTVRWGIVATLFGLSLVMKASLWYIPAKIADLTGGDGWYRSYLMEQCFKHISGWWLLGTNDTSDWAATGMPWGGADLCNQYVSCAAGAGLFGLILFILILVRGFRNLGMEISGIGSNPEQKQAEITLWCLGSALFAHVVTFFSITYYDQMHVSWWALVAVIASVTSGFPQNEPIPEMENMTNHLSDVPSNA